MHVLLIHQGFVSPDDAGGTRHYEFGKRFVAAGHDFTIVASDISYFKGQKHEGERHQEYDGVQVRRAWTYNSLHRSFVWRVVAFLSFMVSAIGEGLRVRKVDVVVGTSPPLFQGVSAWLVALLRGKPFVLEVRDLWPEFAIDMGILTNPILIWMSRRLEMFLYRRAHHIIVNSPAYRTYLIERGVASGKITFIANGVDPQMFESLLSGDNLRQQWNLDGKFVVTYAGALGMANDLDTVLEAARQLADDPQIHVLIVGDGMQRRHLEQRTLELGLGNVTFTGARPKTDMPQILALSDVCLATLKDIPMFRTVYPNKVFDYMAAARPIVLGMDGVIRDVIEASGGGIAVPPGDAGAIAAAVRELSRDQHRGREMGEAARDYVREHFHRDTHARQFQALMEATSTRRAA